MSPPTPSARLPNRCRRLLASLLLVCWLLPIAALAQDPCAGYEDYASFLRLNSSEECEKATGRHMPNLPILRSVHCFNNGTGLCKAIAGRFEFYFNTFTDEVLGPVEDSKYVKNGMHFNRVPHAYNVNGKVLYADRTINWARNQTRDMEKLNLLSLNDFNWCQYTVKDNWPYRAAIKDPQSKGRYYIYFFNKQTCVFDTKTRKRLQYNTRFIHKSKARLDQDFNPALFVFEDHISGDFRLVKHKRQHWYEVKYKVLENPMPGLDYFILIDPSESRPCKINGTDSHPIISKRAYRKFSNICLSDGVHKRPESSPDNSQLVSNWCGYDEVELADLNVVTNRIEPGRLYECDLHNLPRHPPDNERFFGVSFRNDEEWMQWAKDNMAFTAVTTIPVANPNQVRVIMLWAKYLEKPSDSYDEHYPLPYISDYIATFSYSGQQKMWDVSQRDTNAKPFKNLNFVDDIAYLYECKTILVILGPLYTELPPDKFTDLSTKALTGSIYDLGARELVNAFFQHPNEPNTLYMFYRVNYIAKHKYTCGNPDGSSLVTATLVSDYHSRYGSKQFPWIIDSRATRYFFTEEVFFKALDVVPKNQEVIKSPPSDPNDFPYEYELDTVTTSDPNVWLYYMSAVVMLIILLMGLVCLITLRRRRRHQKKLEAITAQGTLRSSALEQSRDSTASNMPSARSGLPTREMTTLPSQRSSNISSIRGGSTASDVNRTLASSALTARSGQSARLSNASNRTNRSSIRPTTSSDRSRSQKKRSTSGSRKRG